MSAIRSKGRANGGIIKAVHPITIAVLADSTADGGPAGHAHGRIGQYCVISPAAARDIPLNRARLVISDGGTTAGAHLSNLGESFLAGYGAVFGLVEDSGDLKVDINSYSSQSACTLHAEIIEYQDEAFNTGEGVIHLTDHDNCSGTKISKDTDIGVVLAEPTNARVYWGNRGAYAIASASPNYMARQTGQGTIVDSGGTHYTRWWCTTSGSVTNCFRACQVVPLAT